jgi:hypothetical protein
MEVEYRRFAPQPTMKVIMPIRRKHKRAGIATALETPAPPETAPAPETAPTPETAPESTPPKSTPPPDAGGLIRKSTLRRFLKREFAFPLKVRESFFNAMEAKVIDDLRRSVARARELKRSTLMAPDA